MLWLLTPVQWVCPLLWWRCEVAEHDGDTPLQAACYAIFSDPERTFNLERQVAGWGYAADGAHFASVVSPVGYQS